LHVKTNKTQTSRTKADGMSDGFAQEMMLLIAEMYEKLAKRAEKAEAKKVLIKGLT
jgi:hypothetical protein